MTVGVPSLHFMLDVTEATGLLNGSQEGFPVAAGSAKEAVLI
jgi:hypothetical protein